MYAETSSGCFLLLFHLRCIPLDLNVTGLFEDSTPTETLIMLSRQNKFLKHLKHLIHLCINLLFFFNCEAKILIIWIGFTTCWYVFNTIMNSYSMFLLWNRPSVDSRLSQLCFILIDIFVKSILNSYCFSCKCWIIFHLDDVLSFALLCKTVVQNIDQIIKDPTWNATLMSPRVPGYSWNLDFHPVTYSLFPQLYFFSPSLRKMSYETMSNIRQIWLVLSLRNHSVIS